MHLPLAVGLVLRIIAQVADIKQLLNFPAKYDKIYFVILQILAIILRGGNIDVRSLEMGQYSA